MISFIMGFVSGLLFSLIGLLAMAWSNIQKKKGNNSSTFDWEKGEYNRGAEDPKNKKKNKLN